MAIKLNTIEEAILDIQLGKMVIVVDDEDRENEGDLVMAAEKVRPEDVNFMATYGKGLICVPLKESDAIKLGLDEMVKKIRMSLEPISQYLLMQWIQLQGFQQKNARTQFNY